MDYIHPSEKEARAYRRAFFDKFLDKSLPQYRAVMGHGDVYGSNSHHSHLWECFKNYKVISRETALNIASDCEEALVTWEPSARIKIRALEKSPLIILSGKELAETVLNDSFCSPEKRSFLPRDIYVFDRNLSFYIAFINKYISGVGFICLTSLEVPENCVIKQVQV